MHLKWNPHPCGFYGDIKRQCRCSTRQIENYRQRISGPLLDRIDIHCEVPLVDFKELSSNTGGGEKSAIIRERVVAARNIQGERFRRSRVIPHWSLSILLVFFSDGTNQATPHDTSADIIKNFVQAIIR